MKSEQWLFQHRFIQRLGPLGRWSKPKGKPLQHPSSRKMNLQNEPLVAALTLVSPKCNFYLYDMQLAGIDFRFTRLMTGHVPGSISSRSNWNNITFLEQISQHNTWELSDTDAINLIDAKLFPNKRRRRKTMTTLDIFQFLSAIDALFVCFRIGNGYANSGGPLLKIPHNR